MVRTEGQTRRPTDIFSNATAMVDTFLGRRSNRKQVAPFLSNSHDHLHVLQSQSNPNEKDAPPNRSIYQYHRTHARRHYLPSDTTFRACNTLSTCHGSEIYLIYLRLLGLTRHGRSSSSLLHRHGQSLWSAAARER